MHLLEANAFIPENDACHLGAITRTLWFDVGDATTPSSTATAGEMWVRDVIAVVRRENLDSIFNLLINTHGAADGNLVRSNDFRFAGSAKLRSGLERAALLRIHARLGTNVPAGLDTSNVGGGTRAMMDPLDGRNVRARPYSTYECPSAVIGRSAISDRCGASKMSNETSPTHCCKFLGTTDPDGAARATRRPR